MIMIYKQDYWWYWAKFNILEMASEVIFVINFFHVNSDMSCQ